MTPTGRPRNVEKRQRDQEAFLVAFAKTGIATSAILETGLPYTHHYRWLKEDPDYARRFAEIKEQTRDLAEANRKPRTRGPRVGRPPDLEKRRQRQEAFLEALVKTGVLMDAARAAGTFPSEFYRWCQIDPEFKERAERILSDVQDVRQQVVSERLSEASKDRWNDPERRAAWSEFQQQTWTPEKRAAAGQRSLERMADPEYKAMWAEANRAAASTPEARAANSERMKRVWQDPEFQARHAATMASPETREKISAAVKQQWADLPEDERKARMKSMRRVFKGGYKLTRIEAEVMAALNDRDLPYLAHKPIDGYVADILVPSLHLVIECDGAWHHPQRADSDAKRDEDLRALGYETLRLSEAEINAKDWTRLDAEIARLSQ